MLSCHDFNDIPIESYKQERLQAFMLSDSVYISISFYWLKVEVIAKIQYFFK